MSGLSSSGLLRYLISKGVAYPIGWFLIKPFVAPPPGVYMPTVFPWRHQVIRCLPPVFVRQDVNNFWSQDSATIFTSLRQNMDNTFHLSSRQYEQSLQQN